MSEAMSALFAEEPGQWGLRGDPYAWAALRVHLEATPLPTDPDVDVQRLLLDAFSAVLGVDLDDPAAPGAVYGERFDHGGMSAGAVDVRWWRERLVPLLVLRAQARQRALDAARHRQTR